jgi:hypothetical protein
MKNMGKLTILMVAVVAIGIFALPSVMSVGTGQHTFNNGTMVNCNKCHANAGDAVNNELLASGLTMYNTNLQGVGVKIHAMDGDGWVGQCKDCHSLTAEPADGSHTGVTMKPVCVDCHSGVATEIADLDEAHQRFSTTGNAGCLGCHTAVSVAGSPSYSYSASVTALGLTIGNGPVASSGGVFPP